MSNTSYVYGEVAEPTLKYIEGSQSTVMVNGPCQFSTSTLSRPSKFLVYIQNVITQPRVGSATCTQLFTEFHAETEYVAIDELIAVVEPLDGTG